jgi:hypothetical protein
MSGGLTLRGAIVFLVVFLLFVVITLAYPTLPPGPAIYNMLNVPTTDYPVLGIPATTLVIAIFNGVVYGVIAWIIFSIANMGTKRNKTTQAQAAQQSQK